MYSITKTAEIFGGKNLKATLNHLENINEIPPTSKYRSGAIFKKGWKLEELPLIGEQIGYFPKFKEPIVISVFTTKGGVLKSTLALNIARTAALHNHKVCVIGLDIQGDITTALGYENNLSKATNLEEIIALLNSTKGLADFYNTQASLNDIIVPTDIPNLSLIPETPELVALNDSLGNINRREYWLKERVVAQLKEYFDIIIMDCSPNWNKLTTNALVANDILISPLECKINNFRNFNMFKHFLNEFKEEMQLNFNHIFVPTKYSNNRKLGLEIKEWYETNLENCSPIGIKESVLGEEATALNISLVEHIAGHKIAYEMIDLLKDIHKKIESSIEEKNSHLQNFIGSAPALQKSELETNRWH